jgi:hypothetical protein
MRPKFSKYLFSKGNRIITRLKTANEEIILFLDYDGTLVSINIITILSSITEGNI